jgi:hypothetical protein
LELEYRSSKLTKCENRKQKGTNYKPRIFHGSAGSRDMLPALSISVDAASGQMQKQPYNKSPRQKRTSKALLQSNLSEEEEEEEEEEAEDHA